MSSGQTQIANRSEPFADRSSDARPGVSIGGVLLGDSEDAG